MDQIDVRLSWSNCPTDVLFMILDKIPMSSIAACMFVNLTWRNHVKYFLQVKNIWEQLVNKALNYNVALFKTKSESCDWQQLYCNYMLWHHVRKASLKLQQVEKIHYIKKLYVSQECLIILTHKNVQLYDVKSLTKKNTWDVKCQDVCIINSIVILITEGNNNTFQFKFCRKLNDGYFGNISYFYYKILDIICYKILGNQCCFIDQFNALYVFNTKSRMLPEFKARFYDYISSKCETSVNILNVQHYLLRDDWMFWVDPILRNFKKITSVEMLKVTGTVNREKLQWYTRAKVEGHFVNPPTEDDPAEDLRKELYVSSCAWYNMYNESIVVMNSLYNVSCLLQHNNVLFLGYSDGTLEVRNGQAPLSEGPLLRFELQDLHRDIEDLQIESIEIYEDVNKHLYIATRTHIYHVSLTFKNLDSFNLWSDEVYSFLFEPSL